jgi:cytochrome o ubiquinol oxidase operon protein cyoD
MSRQQDNTGASHGNTKNYGLGFLLSVILTVIAFGAVMAGGMPRGGIIATIFTAAVLQIVIHLHYFLHLDASSASRWNVLALIFTVMIIVLFVGGSLWIMWHLDYRMM